MLFNDLPFKLYLWLLEYIPLTFSQTSHNVSSTGIVLNVNTKLLISDADGPPATVASSLLINDYPLLTYEVWRTQHGICFLFDSFLSANKRQRQRPFF